MSDSTLIKAPKLTLGTGNTVVDLDSRKPAHGIVVLNSQRAAPAATESPYTAMKRWSAFRQSPSKTKA